MDNTIDISWQCVAIWMTIIAFIVAVWAIPFGVAYQLGGWCGVTTFVAGFIILVASFVIALLTWPKAARLRLLALWALTTVAIVCGLTLLTIFFGSFIPLKVWWWKELVDWSQQWLLGATVYGVLAVSALIVLTCQNEKKEAKNA